MAGDHVRRAAVITDQLDARSRFAIDQNPTANYTHSDTGSEDVEESSLSSSGYALLISIERSVDIPLTQSKYQV